MNLARRTMNAPALAAVYERVWRPAVFYLATGRTTTFDRHYATRTLRSDSARRVLDIACGPGNFTRYLSERLPEDGFAVGVDYSPPMPARALADNSGPRVFDGHVFPDLFTECGLIEVKQQVHRTFQYLTAVRPAEPE